MGRLSKIKGKIVKKILGKLEWCWIKLWKSNGKSCGFVMKPLAVNDGITMEKSRDYDKEVE